MSPHPRPEDELGNALHGRPATAPLLARLEGLKFPDEQVTRFFFKSGLHRRTGRTRATELIRRLAPTLAPGALIFCRFRTPADYRYGKVESLGEGCFRLTIDETSEHGCTIALYRLEAMLEVLAPCRIDPSSLRLMTLVFDNLGRDDRMIRNDELVLWAHTHEQPIT